MKLVCNISKAEKGEIILKYNGFLADTLDLSKTYDVEIKEYKSKRSIDSNKMFWGILEKIKEVTDNDLMDLYIDILEKANAKYDYLMVLPDAVEELKKCFRAVKVMEYRNYNGKNMAVVKVWIGSSKYNTKEMSILIDKALQVAAEYGISIDTSEL